MANRGPNSPTKLWISCIWVRFSGKFGIWIEIAINVIENAKMASLKEITCSSLILVCIEEKSKQSNVIDIYIIYCDIQRSTKASPIPVQSRTITTIAKAKR
jgi:hypothetical protein